MSSTAGVDSGSVALRKRFGEDLRGVMSYTSSGKVEIHDVRDDLGQERGVLVRENWTKELLIEVFSKEVQEENFDLGSLMCTTRYFEDATVLNFIHSAERGVVVSFDPDVDIDRQLLSWCREQLAVSCP